MPSSSKPYQPTLTECIYPANGWIEVTGASKPKVTCTKQEMHYYDLDRGSPTCDGIEELVFVVHFLKYKPIESSERRRSTSSTCSLWWLPLRAPLEGDLSLERHQGNGTEFVRYSDRKCTESGPAVGE